MVLDPVRPHPRERGRDAEAGDLGPAVDADPHMMRRKLPVEHAGGVTGREPLERVTRDPEGDRLSEAGGASLGDQRREKFALDVLEDDEDLPVGHAHIDERQHARMPQ